MNVLDVGSSESSGFLPDNLGPWNEIECKPLESLLIPPPVTAGVPSAAPSGGIFSDSEARDFLLGNDITVNKSNCSSSGQTNCTSLDNIRQETLNAIVELKKSCPNCYVQVSGGTEAGHNDGACSHGSGCKIDIVGNQTTNNYIKSSYTPSGTRSDGAALYTDSKTGAVYANEGSHWDIAVPNQN